MRYTPNTFAIQVYPSVLSRIHWIRMGYTYGYCICPLAPGYAQDIPRMHVSAPWLPMSAKILPKYAADTRICTPFLPSSTSSLTPSPLSKEPLRLLVARVRLALRDSRQRRSVLLRWACLQLLVRPLADGRRLVAQVELLQDVVDGENVTADALVARAALTQAGSQEGVLNRSGPM